MNRIIIVAVALILGYGIRAVVAGGYFLAPVAVVLAVLLVWLVMRPTKRPINPYRSSQ